MADSPIKVAFQKDLEDLRLRFPAQLHGWDRKQFDFERLSLLRDYKLRYPRESWLNQSPATPLPPPKLKAKGAARKLNYAESIEMERVHPDIEPINLNPPAGIDKQEPTKDIIADQLLLKPEASESRPLGVRAAAIRATRQKATDLAQIKASLPRGRPRSKRNNVPRATKRPPISEATREKMKIAARERAKKMPRGAKGKFVKWEYYLAPKTKEGPETTIERNARKRMRAVYENELNGLY